MAGCSFFYRRFHTYTAAAALLALAVLAPVAHAQDIEAQDINVQETPGAAPDTLIAATHTAIAQSLTPVTLDTVSVSATRNPIDAFEYPGMVTVIGPERIQTLQPSTPDDILRFVPGVEFIGGPRRSGEEPSIRGFSGPDVIITLDGARQNFNSAHDGRLFVDPSLIQRVEVLRGPASSLYGSGGLGGLIAFETVDAADLLAPGETAGARISVGYQDVNSESYGTLTAYGMPTQTLDLLGSFTLRESDSIELGNGSELDNTDDDIHSGMAKIGFEPAPHHRIEASFIRFTNGAQEPNNAQGFGVDGLVNKDIRADSWRLGYRYNDPDNHWVDLNALVYHTEFQTDELRLDTLGAGPVGELLKRDVNTLGMRLENTSRWQASDSIDARFTYGIEVYRDKQDGASAAGNRNGVPDAESNFYGVFAQTEVSVTQPFGVIPGEVLMIGGLRYDHYKSESDLAASNKDDEISPRVGMSYLPVDWLMFFGNYAEAFRAPTYDEMYTTGVHFAIPLGPPFGTVVNRFTPNPNLKPQRTSTVEWGIGLDFDHVITDDGRLTFKASHFDIDGTNFINLEVIQPELFTGCFPLPPGGCDGFTRSSNVADADLSGNEIEASFENYRLRLGFGYSAIDGEDANTGEPLGVLAPNQYSVIAALKLPEIDSILGWRGQWANKFTETLDPAEIRDSYDVHDFFFAWAPSSGALEGLRIDLGVDNAFDESYARVYTDSIEAGRNYKALVSYTVNW